jgi:hypothetical protein
MVKRKKSLTPEEREKMLAGLHRDVAMRQQGYREQALRLFPHLCARCGRAFEGRRLRELTVHHKDHNHNNNPPDGSNWELLCLYCHDHEHEKYKMAGHGDGGASDTLETGPSIFSPFERLDGLLKLKDDSKSEKDGNGLHKDRKERGEE